VHRDVSDVSDAPAAHLQLRTGVLGIHVPVGDARPSVAAEHCSDPTSIAARYRTRFRFDHPNCVVHAVPSGWRPVQDEPRRVGHAGAVITPRLDELGSSISEALRRRGETVGVAEGSAGGLISATLLAVPGASVYYAGGAVVYTRPAIKAFMAGPVEAPAGMRGATEGFAEYLAASVAAQLGSTWGLSEAGAAGPPNPYGDPAGHCWVVVAGPARATRHVLTGEDDRPTNMVLFAVAALELLLEQLD
jgi:nicotinamide-nucleotide amidase